MDGMRSGPYCAARTEVDLGGCAALV